MMRRDWRDWYVHEVLPDRLRKALLSAANLPPRITGAQHYTDLRVTSPTQVSAVRRHGLINETLRKSCSQMIKIS